MDSSLFFTFHHLQNLRTKRRLSVALIEFSNAAFCVATMDSIPPRASANKVKKFFMAERLAFRGTTMLQ